MLVFDSGAETAAFGDALGFNGMTDTAQYASKSIVEPATKENCDFRPEALIIEHFVGNLDS